MVFNQVLRARKKYTCDQCGLIIRPREVYLRNDSPWTRDTTTICYFCLTGKPRPKTLEEFFADARISTIKDEMAAISTERKSVFLSHCHEDKRFAKRLANDLQGKGVNVWIDDAEIRVGDSLLEKISEGIRSVDYVVVLLSRESVRSSWVRKELEMAMNREIKGKTVVVLPLLLESCQLPPFLEGKLYADFREEGKYAQNMKLVLDRVRGSS